MSKNSFLFFHSRLLQLSIKIGIIFSFISLIYGQNLSLIFSKALSFDTGDIGNYILVFPFLIGFIIYKKRNKLKNTIQLKQNKIPLLSEKIIGSIICMIAITIFLFASSTFYILEYQVMSLVVFIVGITIVLFNTRTLRESFFVIILITFLIPIPNEFVSFIISGMNPITTILVNNLLNQSGILTVLDSTENITSILVKLSDGSRVNFRIGAPSSGIYSMITLSSLGLFIAYIIKSDKFWKRIAVWIVGFPIMFLLNVLRIYISIILWYFFEGDVAEGYHVISGSIMIGISAAVLLIFGEKILGTTIYSKIQKNKNTKNSSKSIITFLGSKIQKNMKSKKNRIKTSSNLLLIVLMVSGLLALTIHEYAFGQESLPAIELSSIDGNDAKILLPKLEKLDLGYAYRSYQTESILDHDLWIALYYTNDKENSREENGNKDLTLYSIIQIGYPVHRWESSLLLQGRETVEIFEQKDILILDDGTQGRFLAYKKAGDETTKVIFYWFEEIPIKSEFGLEKRYAHLMLWTSMEYLQSRNIIDDVNDYKKTGNFLMSFAKPIAMYWKQDIWIEKDSHRGLLLYGLNHNVSNFYPDVVVNTVSIPLWIKNAAQRWSEDKISEKDFILGIQHLLEQKVIKFPIKQIDHNMLEERQISSTLIPVWVKNTAKWWSYDQISDSEFLNAIQYLLQNKIILISTNNESNGLSIITTMIIDKCTGISHDNLLENANLLAGDYNFLQAIKCYDRILENDPNHVNAIIGKANSLEGLDKTHEAIQLYDTILKTNPENVNALNGKANSLLRNGDIEESVQYYQQVLSIDSENTNAHKGKERAEKMK